MEKSQLSRRNFLGKSALIGAAGVIGMNALASCSSKSKTVDYVFPPVLDKAPDGKKLRAGLVGCGNRGTGAALNFLSAGNDLELVAWPMFSKIKCGTAGIN
jgi:myo-inositol 2-dehydrogenase / D-chiro-inositol 1-dehydrogenase